MDTQNPPSTLTTKDRASSSLAARALSDIDEDDSSSSSSSHTTHPPTTPLQSFFNTFDSSSTSSSTSPTLSLPPHPTSTSTTESLTNYDFMQLASFAHRDPLPPTTLPHDIPTSSDSLPPTLDPSFYTNTVLQTPVTNLGELQEWNETMAFEKASKEYVKMIKQAKNRNDIKGLNGVQKQFVKWFQPLVDSIKEEQDACMAKISSSDRTNYGPILVLLPASKLAVLTMHTITSEILQSKDSSDGVIFVTAVTRLGEAVRAELGVLKVLYERENGLGSYKDKKMKELLGQEGGEQGEEAGADNQEGEKLLDDEDYEWTPELKAKVGAVLISKLVDSAVGDDNKPAFIYDKEKRATNKLVGFVKLSPFVKDRFMMEDSLDHMVHVRHLPMVIPPKPWTDRSNGVYYFNQVNMMRTHGCALQTQALDHADLKDVFKGLNALGATPWKINKEILDVQEKAWKNGMTVGKLPSTSDYDVPVKPGGFDDSFVPRLKDGRWDKDHPDFEAHKKSYLEHLDKEKHYLKQRQRNSELHSLRCDTIIKLDQARQFKDFEKIFFGWNLDFRGRAYPVPPNLNHLGSDLCRGLLSFSEKKPLTEKGFYWLKVNLANLYGADKISMDKRAQFVDDNWEDVVKSAKDPLNNLWWDNADDPWQALAVCKELVKAVESGDPATYESSSSLAWTEAAMGYSTTPQDKQGGAAVNLTPMETPQDVYTGVLDIVLDKMEEQANKPLGPNPSEEDLKKQACAKRLQGLVTRKVVKQTVMTSVYGVTYLGARQQIMNRLEEKFEEIGLDVYDNRIEEEIFECSKYLAKLTLSSLDEMFSNARSTMAWLGEVASIVASQRQPMSWMTPLSLPCVQPYRRKSDKLVNTVIQVMVMVENNANLPVSNAKQRSAFPPNYIHSLDSTHMLMTAIEMEKRGLPFSAVHDSYWCHPQNVDEMNEVLREKFVELYSKPLLENLKSDLENRYGNKLTFPDVPEFGELDLNDIK
eukprot:CAMPEP_0118649176 /NCGR_PEP_ID=MMETSP0785-20121206/9562_1 /TAXON_ID=91992 /ORGANISM="Bolidomonas pacifica, Strain CCMP 1866" /LENGTH=982 /DNA_ID=CAMNT_0006541443 /DNA_START=220 /DNA_END=3167 /DNA_ORIENTATION=+